MNQKIVIIFFILTAFIQQFDVHAQESKMNCVSSTYDYVLDVEKVGMEVVDDKVVVSLKLLAKQDVPENQSVILVPELKDTISERSATFPVIYVNSRRQQIFYEREISRYIKDAMAVRKYKGKNLKIDYLQSKPYERWMETSVLVLRKLSCSCNVSTARGEEWLCRLREVKEYIDLMPAYRIPAAAGSKVRQEKGSANLQFQVSKWDILPNLKNNANELKKIYSTIDLVKNDPNVKITKMSIEGYASPEGKLENNISLSEKRTNALKEFLENLALLPDVSITAAGRGENWSGFMKYLETHTTFPQHDIIKSIAKEDLSPDAKEAKMKKDAPEGFRYCLNTIFPSLRCTDYAVEYTIRPFTLDESEEIFDKRPMQLSLDEIYRLADKHKNDSLRYNQIMQKASLLYPDDPYVNLTMAYLAIKHNAPDDAENFLKKVPDWPEKKLNQAIVAYMKGEKSAEEIKRIQSEYQKELRVKN